MSIHLVYHLVWYKTLKFDGMYRILKMDENDENQYSRFNFINSITFFPNIS